MVSHQNSTAQPQQQVNPRVLEPQASTYSSLF
jgi:hypothetical protein